MAVALPSEKENFKNNAKTSKSPLKSWVSWFGQ
jgi:hypothetical protein